MWTEYAFEWICKLLHEFDQCISHTLRIKVQIILHHKHNSLSVSCQIILDHVFI